MSDAAATPRTVVVGCGHWGRNLVRNVHGLGALAGIVEARADLAAEFCDQYGVQRFTLDEALADPAVDALMIAAPAEAHHDIARRALEADKHVFVEKPLSLRVADAEELVALAAQRDRRLMVGHLLHYHPGFLKLRDMVRNGDLGRLQYIYSNRLNLGKFRREEDVFWSFAPHDISMILALVGEEPDEVIATGAAYLHKRVADVTTTHLSFPSGVHAHVFVSWLHPFKEQKLVVVGDGSMAVFDDRLPWNEKLKLYAHGVNWKNGLPEPIHADAVDVAIDEQEPLRNECAHFLECVATGARPRTDGEEGVRVLRVLAQSAAQAGDARPAAATEAAAAPEPEPRDFFVHESAYVDDGAEIGRGAKIWHFSHVLSGTTIGAGCVLGQNVMVGPDVTVGERCKIQNNVSLYKGVVLEEGVFCGPSCVFTNVLNPRAEVERKDEFRETRVGRGATIGANATIVCGHPIGEYAFIGAGAVVTKPVPAYALMAGVPATRIGWMSAAGERLGDDLTCPRTGARYELRDDDTLIPIDPAPAGSEARR